MDDLPPPEIPFDLAFHAIMMKEKISMDIVKFEIQKINMINNCAMHKRKNKSFDVF
jgi:hypothetical protein